MNPWSYLASNPDLLNGHIIQSNRDPQTVIGKLKIEIEILIVDVVRINSVLGLN